MIVDPTLAHATEGVLDGLEKPRIICAQAGAPKHFEDCGLRKLRSAAQTAVDLVEHVADLHCGPIKLLQSDRHLARRSCLFGKSGQQRCAVLFDSVGLLAEQPGYLAQNVDEGGPAEARFFRKIRATPDRLCL